MSDSAVRAAIEVGHSAGYAVPRPVVLPDANNVVVWLPPRPVGDPAGHGDGRWVVLWAVVGVKATDRPLEVWRLRPIIL